MIARKEKTSLKDRRQSGIVLAVVAMMFFGVAGANAASVVSGTTPVVPGYHWVTTSTGSTVLVPTGSPENKRAWTAAHPVSGSDATDPSSLALHPSNTVVTPYASTIGSSSLSSTGSLPYNGSTMEATGSTNLSWTTNLLDYVAFSNSAVHDYWWGGSPYMANAISPLMKWWLTGISVSVSIPLGVAFSGAGGSAVIYAPGSVLDNWQAHAFYPYNVNESAALVWSANFQTYGDFLFGSSWYRVQGN